MNETENIPNSAEIDKALKEFEAKSTGASTSAGVSFETDAVQTTKRYEETTVPAMVRLVIKYSGGAIKDQRMAEYVLFGFVVVVMGISIFLFVKAIFPHPHSAVDKNFIIAGPQSGK